MSNWLFGIDYRAWKGLNLSPFYDDVTDLHRYSTLIFRRSLQMVVTEERKAPSELSAFSRTCKPVVVDGLEDLSRAKEPVQVVSTRYSSLVLDH